MKSKIKKNILFFKIGDIKKLNIYLLQLLSKYIMINFRSNYKYQSFFFHYISSRSFIRIKKNQKDEIIQ